MIKTGLGISNNLDFKKAGEEAAKEAIQDLSETPDLFLVAMPFGFDSSQALAGISSVADNIPLAGGTAGWGVITHKGIKEKEVVVLALKFQKIKTRVVKAENLSKDALKAGTQLGKELLKDNQRGPDFLIVFPGGLGVAFDIFLKGLKKELGAETNVLGGGTGDSMALQSGGRQFYNNQVLEDTVVGVGFWDGFKMAIQADHGWEPLGIPMKITKAEGIFVSEIDNKPASQIFEKYFTKEEIMDAKFFSPHGEGILYPLGIISEKPERTIVRQVVGVTEKGELMCATNMPSEATVRIMQVQTSKMIEVAGNVGKSLRGSPVDIPHLAFVFDCVVRKLLLIPDQHREIDAFIESIGNNIPVFGFFSYGEICSEKKEKEWFVHNETFTAGLLGE